MAVAAVKTKKLTQQDLDLDATYQGNLRSEFLDPNHSYRVVKRIEDAYLQPCALCAREQQARIRIGIVNATVGTTFYVGRVCLLKHFGLTEKDLEKSTVILTTLARVWEAYARKTGQEATFSSTREAVEDMFQKFFLLSSRKALFMGAVAALRRILDDLAHINDYRPDVTALQNLVGILFEAQLKPYVLADRIVAATHHPLLGPHERANAGRVLRFEDVTWPQLRNFTETFRAVANKSIPIKIKQVPIYNFGEFDDYLIELKAHADTRLAALDADDKTYRPDEYYQKVRDKAAALKATPGYCELVFESSSLSSLERLQLPSSIEKTLGDVVYLISPSPKSYIRYHHISRKFNSAAAMQRAAQQDDKDENTREPEKRYYRSVILYRPDPYLPCYAKWQKYGGVKNGREHLEDLTRELLAAS